MGGETNVSLVSQQCNYSMLQAMPISSGNAACDLDESCGDRVELELAGIEIIIRDDSSGHDMPLCCLRVSFCSSPNVITINFAFWLGWIS